MTGVLGILSTYLTKEITVSLFSNSFDIAYFQFGMLLGVTTFMIAVMLSMGGHSSVRASMNFFKTVISAPIIEELIFRLGLITVITLLTNSVALAIIISALLFAVGHQIIYGGLRLVDTFITGLLWGWAFVTFGIGVTMIAHMTHNFLASVIR